MGATPLWGPEVRDDVYIWQDDAACKGADPVLFEILNKDHPASEGLDLVEQVEQTRENFEDAATYCDRCPVRAACMADATPEDLHWTFRAGVIPGAFSGKAIGRPPSIHTHYETVGGVKRCRKNHEYDASLTRCPQCKVIYKRWYQKKKLREEKPWAALDAISSDPYA